MHHARLSLLLAPAAREALVALSTEDVWRLERRSDVDLDAVYGAGTVELEAGLPGN